MNKEENQIIFKLSLEDYESREEAKVMLQASDMYVAINCYYDDVLRKYFKYEDITQDQYDLLHKVTGELHEYFGRFFSE